jgi:hypothetical protein
MAELLATRILACYATGPPIGHHFKCVNVPSHTEDSNSNQIIHSTTLLVITDNLTSFQFLV